MTLLDAICSWVLENLIEGNERLQDLIVEALNDNGGEGVWHELSRCKG